ncbi:unnamed protein product [Allacma fusca]|uniref:Uncharacterized protein n=1 Tax=Allacma fusca TaxID=39272 RepID=A0A8J2LCH7_9HEXA|nr:unnamed protein product [Allacma fusca]
MRSVFFTLLVSTCVTFAFLRADDSKNWSKHDGSPVLPKEFLDIPFPDESNDPNYGLKEEEDSDEHF